MRHVEGGDKEVGRLASLWEILYEKSINKS